MTDQQDAAARVDEAREWRAMYRSHPDEEWHFSYPLPESQAREEAAFLAKFPAAAAAIERAALAEPVDAGEEAHA